MLTKDVASAYVIARRGLGLRERIPKVYRDLLNKLQNNLDGTSKGIPNPWQVLKVVVLTALSAKLAPATGGGGDSPVKGAIFETPWL